MADKNENTAVGSPDGAKKVLLQQSELGWRIDADTNNGANNSRLNTQDRGSWYGKADESQTTVVFY